MFAVWVVEHRTRSPMRLVQHFSDPESGLLSASRILRGIGARGVRASNVSWGDHDEALLVEDINGLLPLAVVVTGARIEEADGSPVVDDVLGCFDDSAEVEYH